MNKRMKVPQPKLRGWMPAVLLVLVAMGAGCQRSAKCDEAGVVCADEFEQRIGVLVSDDGVGCGFTTSDPNISTTVKYKVVQRWETQQSDDMEVSKASYSKAGGGIYVGMAPLYGASRVSMQISDIDPALGTSQTCELCLDSNNKRQDCKAWAAAKLPDPVTITNDNALAHAPKVRCGKLTYQVTNQESDSGDIPWSDLTWTVRSPANYDMGKAATARGHRYTLFQLGPFETKPLDTVEMLGKKPEAAKWPTSLVGRVATELRLPLRIGVAELVNSSKNNTDVLRAGWAFKDTASGKEVNLGCAIKQTVLAEILSTALGGKAIGDQTVHILFSAASDQQPVGEKGWCYKVTAKGQSPLLKPYSGTESGKQCESLL